MKEYLTYIVAACTIGCATTAVKDNTAKPAEEYSVKPIVMKSTRDCSNLPPQELIDCITEEEAKVYAPAPVSPTTPTYTVTPKAVKVDRDCSNLSGQELFDCISEAEIIEED